MNDRFLIRKQGARRKWHICQVLKEKLFLRKLLKGPPDQNFCLVSYFYNYFQLFFIVTQNIKNEITKCIPTEDA